MDTPRQVTVDRSGRVLIPKTVRVQLGLSPGTRLLLESHEGQEIRLRPLDEKLSLVDKQGVLVVQGAALGELEGIERRERVERLDDLMRKTGL